VKITTIIGARPQFIKAGTVSRELLKFPDVQENIIHTGQHYDENMSDIFFEEMEIPKPAFHLGVGGTSQGDMTGRMIQEIEKILVQRRPDYVMLYGDTNSTMAGAIAASKLHIKIIHIESGLRSFNMKMPEEVNRIITDRLSYMLFCPTDSAIANLKAEGVENWCNNFMQSGDVMQDGAFFYREKSKKPEIPISDGGFILTTIHRAENTDERSKLEDLLRGINEIAANNEVVFPIHPRTKSRIDEFSIDVSENITFIDPVGYLNSVWLLSNCKAVLTDSGGMQKEAFFFEKPCITLREETEWVELLEEGVNILVGSSSEKLRKAFDNINDIEKRKFDQSIYGNGLASQVIVSKILSDYHNDTS
jgi:UDP-GlcNAc3NAcA epimerase